MGRELTLRHSELLDKKVKNPFSFAHDIFRYGKSSELLSFIVWEIFHQLGLFSKNKYLKFNDGVAFALGKETLNEVGSSQKLEHFFASKGLRVSRCAYNWKLLFINSPDEMYGCMYTDDRDLYRHTGDGTPPVLISKFPAPIKSIFISSRNTIFVCAKGAVYTSSDNGASFKKSLELGSSESFFRHNNAMTETPDGTLVIGEYGNVWDSDGWRKLPFLYFSSDNGETWSKSDFLLAHGINKHIHLVKYSKSLNKLFMADGDNKKKLWVTDSLTLPDLINPSGWKPVNKVHIQMGGYTSVVENGQTVLFGTDYQGGTNFLVATQDGEKYEKRIVPDPYRRSPIDNMVQRRSKTGIEIWANLPYSTAHTKCLLMYSPDAGQSWNRVIEYNRAAHKVWILSSSGGVTEDMYVSVEDRKNSQRVVYKITD